jgi:hypothetical protein
MVDISNFVSVHLYHGKIIIKKYKCLLSLNIKNSSSLLDIISLINLFNNSIKDGKFIILFANSKEWGLI